MPLKLKVSPAAQLLSVLLLAVSPVPASKAPVTYRWMQRVAAAPFPGSYNYPVFVVRGEAWSMHPRGAWRSADGLTWKPTRLPKSGLNSGLQKYLQLGDAVYSLGALTGNYERFTIDGRIQRTTDLEHWELVGTSSTLPQRVFYGAATYNNKLWLIGGFDGTRYHNDVWSSADGVHWTRVLEHAPFTPRTVDVVTVFQNRLWLMGGGVIDGDRTNPNPNSLREVWSTTDGITWTRHADRPTALFGGTPVVYDNRLWLIGVNRRGTFDPATMSTSDVRTWTNDTAPWPARGAPAVWVMNDQLFMTGGKYSEGSGANIRFLYRNDVWSMARAR